MKTHKKVFAFCKIIESHINKVLDVKPLVPFIITEYANSLPINGQFWKKWDVGKGLFQGGGGYQNAMEGT